MMIGDDLNDVTIPATPHVGRNSMMAPGSLTAD
jgi:hypothetical protein